MGIRDFWAELGALGGNVREIIVNALEHIGSDGSGDFTNVTATNGDINILETDQLTLTGSSGSVVLDTSDVRLNLPVYSVPAADQTLANDGTIAAPAGLVQVVTNSGNVTGIIMTAGTLAGQIAMIVNKGSGSVTFAAAGTSNVADGTSAVIATLRSVVLIWDAGASRWYRTG